VAKPLATHIDPLNNISFRNEAMNIELNTPAQTNVDQKVLRDLLDSEIVLIGGGEAAGNSY
jgi:hypothetical protein